MVSTAGLTTDLRGVPVISSMDRPRAASMIRPKRLHFAEKDEPFTRSEFEELKFDCECGSDTASII